MPERSLILASVDRPSEADLNDFTCIPMLRDESELCLVERD
jgi:hypothetical protein